MNDEIRDLIKESVDIVEVISKYVELKKVGAYYVGHCPFHKNDDTPSFRVYPKTQSFYCFGCDAGSANSITHGSDVIAFVSSIEHLEFEEAITKLAENYNIDITKEFKDNRGSYYKKNLEMSREFYTSLYSNDKALEYLYNRGLTDDDISNWRIGYAEDGYFAERIVFSILDSKDKNTILFTARKPNDEKCDDKYIHSKTNPFVTKSQCFYGMNKAYDQIKEKLSCYIVEGPLDEIAMYKSGLINSISSLGCAISDEQVEIIARNKLITPIIVYDGDEAGRKATYKACMKFIQYDISPSFVKLPSGQDPHDIYMSGENLKEYITLHTESFVMRMVTEDIMSYNEAIFKASKEFMAKINVFKNDMPDGEVKDALTILVNNIISGGIK